MQCLDLHAGPAADPILVLSHYSKASETLYLSGAISLFVYRNAANRLSAPLFSPSAENWTRRCLNPRIVPTTSYTLLLSGNISRGHIPNGGHMLLD
ncbi:hypothetical protein SISNIDRAFT_289559 [Sistotremastrum niveocremeum HHB9708]|uniref:Uncharacterized protein n=1 Tax=Sistotremastrum niveocremeum HHB9708 TaxID=1314777 RepID=A0A164YHW8_9AGAM|nr:hypothetical protein SISNIDRAFT_289559 [Sistotremastrum niveocremeum HHB9708]